MQLRDMIGAPGVLPADPGKDRVLVVDDDLSQRTMLTRIVRKAGYKPASAMSTEEARNLLSSETFGIVVTDLRMWGENGLELVRYVSDRYPSTYSIVITGFIEEDLERQCRQAGAFALVPKPLDMEKMIEVIRAAFEEREAAVALQRHKSH